MTFGQAIKSVFGNLTNAKGRSRRSEFWWFYLFIFLISIPVSFLVTIPMFATLNSITAEAGRGGELTEAQLQEFLGAMALGYGLLFIFGAITFFLMFAVWVRRLHDAGYSGHWLWFCLVGLGIVPLILAILEGQNYPNKWGPDPKAIDHQVWPHRQAGPAFVDPQAASPTLAQPPYSAPAAPAPQQAAPQAPPPYSPPPTTASGETTDPFAAPPRDN